LDDVAGNIRCRLTQERKVQSALDDVACNVHQALATVGAAARAGAGAGAAARPKSAFPAGRPNVNKVAAAAAAYHHHLAIGPELQAGRCRLTPG